MVGAPSLINGPARSRRPKGDVVTVFGCTFGGKFVIEGRATVLKRIPDIDEQYKIRFHGRDGEPSLGEEYERFIDPAGQTNPQAHLAALNRSAP